MPQTETTLRISIFKFSCSLTCNLEWLLPRSGDQRPPKTVEKIENLLLKELRPYRLKFGAGEIKYLMFAILNYITSQWALRLESNKNHNSIEYKNGFFTLFG